MRQTLQIISLALAIVLGSGCVATHQTNRDRIAEKSAPYEMFAFQRSYPDTVFDWRGWRKMLQSVKTQAAAQARISTDCTSNSALWTEQGPGNVAGRCNTIAVHPNDENTLLAGFSTGGIFKSTDGGVNWHPVFDEQVDLSIGDITYDPSNPDIVYAGTGDPNVPSIAYNGNGIYKSSDGGETWNYLALADKGIISKITVHPTNPMHLVVASMGNPYIRDAERGIFVSKDGGTTWVKTLYVSNQAGASDLVMAPSSPNIMYASFWDRIRNNQESILSGPSAKVFKSDDGGISWIQLSNGLPTGRLGRTGLAVS
ncbi:MAG: hypothetical protein JNJ57_17945, partial [Saprospiraceae bacterium]|nr:hypothetical protein [Saprospiraceae bacterium]